MTGSYRRAGGTLRTLIAITVLTRASAGVLAILRGRPLSGDGYFLAVAALEVAAGVVLVSWGARLARSGGFSLRGGPTRAVRRSRLPQVAGLAAVVLFLVAMVVLAKGSPDGATPRCAYSLMLHGSSICVQRDVYVRAQAAEQQASTFPVVFLLGLETLILDGADALVQRATVPVLVAPQK